MKLTNTLIIIYLFLFSFTQTQTSAQTRQSFDDERYYMSEDRDYEYSGGGGKADWDKIMMMLGAAALIGWWIFKPKEEDSKILTTDVSKK